MIEIDLLALVATSPAYKALCAAAPYPVMLPEQVTFPALTYQLISTVDVYTLDGPLGLVKSRIQIDAWGSTYKQTKTLASAVASLLNGYTGQLTSTHVYDVQRDGAHDDFEPNSRLYRVTSDWLVWSADLAT